MTNEETAISGDFNWQVPTVIPSFVYGKDAELIYNEIRKTIVKGVWYDNDSKIMKGSNTFLAARADSIMRPLGIRAATLADLSRPEIIEMIRGEHYSDIPAIVFRTMKDRYEPNNLLIKKLAPQIEEKIGRLELPVLVTGFDVALSEDKEGHGLNIIPREDFAVLHDERLAGKYNGETFLETDEMGLPKFGKGNRTWYARKEGLSRLCLGGDLDLGSDNGGLADSDVSGRVVLVAREAACAEKKAK